MQEWKIAAYRNKKEIAAWSFDAMKEAKRVWSHLNRKRETIDTADPIDAARLRLPTGALYYLDERVDWR